MGSAPKDQLGAMKQPHGNKAPFGPPAPIVDADNGGYHQRPNGNDPTAGPQYDKGTGKC